MMKTEKILKFLGLNSENDIEEELDNNELFDAEVREVLTELTTIHADTSQYKTAVDNLNTLVHCYETYSKVTNDNNFSEQAKLKMIENMPRVVGYVGSTALMIFWYMVEQGHPVSTRLVNKIDNLLTR